MSGNGNAKQVVLSMRMYNHRLTFLLPAMRALFDIIREDREFGLNKELMCSVSQSLSLLYIKLLSYVENIPHDMNILQAGFLCQSISGSKKFITLILLICSSDRLY